MLCNNISYDETVTAVKMVKKEEAWQKQTKQ
jgi:hypothetical protein